MSSNTGNTYNWTNTSQWSQLPTVPAANNDSATTPPPAPQPASIQNSYTSAPPTPTSNYRPTQAPMEPRREMITRLYKTILGREPDNSGLNYYLFNTQIAEAQIAKEMYESTEHSDILSRAKDAKDLVIKLNENAKQINELEIKLANSDQLLSSYKTLLDREREIIKGIQSSGINIGDHSQEAVQSSAPEPQTNTKQEPVQGVLLNDPFEEDGLLKGKGCLGFLKRKSN